MLCGHFLLEEDVLKHPLPGKIPVISAEKCQGLCDYVTVYGRTLAHLVDADFAAGSWKGSRAALSAI